MQQLSKSVACEKKFGSTRQPMHLPVGNRQEEYIAEHMATPMQVFSDRVICSGFAVRSWQFCRQRRWLLFGTYCSCCADFGLPKLDLEQTATSRGEASSCLVRLRRVLSLSHKRAPRV